MNAYHGSMSGFFHTSLMTVSAFPASSAGLTGHIPSTWGPQVLAGPPWTPTSVDASETPHEPLVINPVNREPEVATAIAAHAPRTIRLGGVTR